MKRTLLNAGIIFGLDAVVIGQGFFAGFIPVFVVIGRLIQALRARRRGDAERARLLRERAAVWAATIVLTIAWLTANNVMAARRAEALVAAVRQYEARHQCLPDSLEALVPEFISSVPRAKYTLLFGHFLYGAAERRHFLMYVFIPPFGRHLYNFEEARWKVLD